MTTNNVLSILFSTTAGIVPVNGTGIPGQPFVNTADGFLFICSPSLQWINATQQGPIGTAGSGIVGPKGPVGIAGQQGNQGPQGVNG